MRLSVLFLLACQAPAPREQTVDLNPKLGTLAVRVGQGGITVEQLKSKLDALAKRDSRIARALVHGAWMTPAVSIPRAKKENQSGSTENDDG